MGSTAERENDDYEIVLKENKRPQQPEYRPAIGGCVGTKDSIAFEGYR